MPYMCGTSLPREGWTSVSLRQELIEEIDRLVESETGKKQGFNSRTDVVTRAILDLIEKTRQFEHLNMMDDHVKVVDYTLKRTASVYFKDGGLVHCDLCNASQCEHIDYALAQPDILKALEQHDWKRKTS
jgi:Arc/MetJ-type ribon-helix-helix transcriptional regulator